jgi:hypothetical protein
MENFHVLEVFVMILEENIMNVNEIWPKLSFDKE